MRNNFLFRLVAGFVKKNPIVFLSIPFLIALWFFTDSYIADGKDGGEGINNLSSYNFEQIVSGSDKPVLVDFGAKWCGPCRKQMAVLGAFVKKYNNVAIYKVDVTEEKQLASKYHINNIPTLILFSGGKEVIRKVGLQTESSLLKMIERSAESVR